MADGFSRRGALGLAASAGVAAALPPGGARAHEVVGRLDLVENFQSAHVPARNLSVWVPPSRRTRRPERPRVLVMQDGQNLFEASQAFGGSDWGADDSVARLMHAERTRPVLIVGIWNTADRRREYMPQMILDAVSPALRERMAGEMGGPALSAAYVRFVVEEVLPWAVNTHGASPLREDTFVAGSSMGGLISLQTLCSHPDRFAGAGCLSTHWPALFQGYDTGNLETPAMIAGWRQALAGALPPPGRNRIWFDHGDVNLDSLYAPYQAAVDETMVARGWRLGRDFQSRTYPGADHNEASWAARLDDPLTFLLRRMPR